jgi:hypothetical protein
MRKEKARWVVAIRTIQGALDCYYYAFRADEIEQLGAEYPERLDLPLERVFDLHEWMSSATSRNGRPIGLPGGGSVPSAERVIDFDATHRVIGVGERLGPTSAGGVSGAITGEAVVRGEGTVKAPPGGTLASSEPIGSGHGLGPPPAATPAPSPVKIGAPSAIVEVTLSAEVQPEIAVGALARVPFQIELSSEAIPLTSAVSAKMDPALPIRVMLSAENEFVLIESAQEFQVVPPSRGQPTAGFFVVKGISAGITRLAMSFRQGGSELGVIGLSIEVVGGAAATNWKRSQAVAAPRDFADDEMLEILIDRVEDGGKLYYEYKLHAEGLNVPWAKLRSKPLLDRGGGAAATVLAFVERIYECVTQELKSFDTEDLKELQRETRALGATLGHELFDPEVTKVLWPLRDRIKLVRIVSWEPYIPWELVRLSDPGSGDIDERFLCEYGLMRSVADEMLPRSLTLQRWAYLGAQVSTRAQVNQDLRYFTATDPQSLRGHGITPRPIPSTRDAFYDALAVGDFDVLHISSHAESQHGSIERAKLIIGEETTGGPNPPQPVEVDTVTVEAEAKLRNRRPLIFLSGCETGRLGALLTGWGGWPNVFLRKGAGAFVGSSWSVRDKPAAEFAATFYNALLGGQTLTEAATAARIAAKALGDASWLAFKVYGHPRAQYAAKPATSGGG